MAHQVEAHRGCPETRYRGRKQEVDTQEHSWATLLKACSDDMKSILAINVAIVEDITLAKLPSNDVTVARARANTSVIKDTKDLEARLQKLSKDHNDLFRDLNEKCQPIYNHCKTIPKDGTMIILPPHVPNEPDHKKRFLENVDVSFYRSKALDHFRIGKLHEAMYEACSKDIDTLITLSGELMHFKSRAIDPRKRVNDMIKSGGNAS